MMSKSFIDRCIGHEITEILPLDTMSDSLEFLQDWELKGSTTIAASVSG